jgi:hypothetical protein
MHGHMNVKFVNNTVCSDRIALSKGPIRLGAFVYMKMEAMPASETQQHMKNYMTNKVQRKRAPSVRHKPSSEPCNLSQISSVLQN